MTDVRVVKVFISSRDKLFDERTTVKRTIDNMGLQPILGDVISQPPSADAKEWLELVRKSDIVILIIADEDSPYVKEEIESCISEGKSVLILREKGEFTTDRSLETFLKELRSYAFISEFSTCAELADKVREGIIIELSKKYRERGEIVPGSVRMVKKAFELIRSAKRQLFLIIRTPPYLLPPEFHDTLDIAFKDIMEEWVKDKIEKWSLKEKENVLIMPEARFFYILPALKKKIGNNKNLLATTIKNLEKYKEIEVKSYGRFKITSITEQISPIAIADQKVCYYSPIYGREGFGIYIRDGNIAKGIIQYIESHYVNYYKTIDELKKELKS